MIRFRSAVSERMSWTDGGKPFARHQRGWGFTIIELLVVISIIALLIAILLPSLAGARDRARYTKWAGYSHGLRTDPGLTTYHNMEAQDGTETNNKDEPIIWNKAAGDANGLAKFATEPEDMNGIMGSTSSVHPNAVFAGGVDPPIWQNTITQGCRWAGKAAIETNLAPGGSAWRAVKVPNTPLMEQWWKGYSIAMWVRADDLGGAANNNYIIEKGSKILILHDSSSNDKKLTSRNRTWDGTLPYHDSRVESESAVPENEWVFIVSMLDTSVKPYVNRLYINGKPQTPQDGTYLHPTDHFELADDNAGDRTFPLQFGSGDFNGDNGFDGLIDEVAVFRRTLQVEEIEAMYRVGRPRRRE